MNPRSFLRGCLPAVCGASALVASFEAHADPKGARLAWVPPACTALPYDAALFEKLLFIELQGAHVDVDPHARDRLTVAPSDCTPEATTVEVSMEGGPGHPRQARTVDLSGVPPEARPRTLALVASELAVEALAKPTVHAASASREPSPATTVVVAPTPPAAWTPPVPPATTTPMRGFVAGLAFAHRAFPIDDTDLTGLELRASIRLYGPLRLRTAVVGLYDRFESDLGVVHVISGSGAIGVSAGLRGELFGFDVGPRLDVGATLAEGHASIGAVVPADPDPSAATVTLGLDAEMQLYLTKGVLGTLGVEGGGALAGLEATSGGRILAGTTGPFFGLRVGLAVAP